MFGPARTWWDLCCLSHEAGLVITLRAMRKPVPGDLEPLTMVAEKPAAFVKAWGAAQTAALKGQSPDGVMRAYLAPLTSRAAANRKRLVGRGPTVEDYQT